MRLHLFMARAGAASRRAAERLIAEGRVRLNGEAVTRPGIIWKPGDRVELDGKLLALEERRLYILLNKPVGRVCTSSDPAGRPTALDLVQPRFKERLYGVGRLDQFSSGLLILTNDGEFARRVGHPSAGIEKEYVVRTEAEIPPGLLEDFERGIHVEGRAYRAAACRELGPNMASIVLVEGRNREIRRVFEAAGARILSLQRIRIGCLRIEGLAEGAYRLITEEEVRDLLRAGGRGRGKGQ